MKFSDQQTRVNFLPISRAPFWEQRNCSFRSCTEDYCRITADLFLFLQQKCCHDTRCMLLCRYPCCKRSVLAARSTDSKITDRQTYVYLRTTVTLVAYISWVNDFNSLQCNQGRIKRRGHATHYLRTYSSNFISKAG